MAECLDEGIALCKEQYGKREYIYDIIERHVKGHFGIKRSASIMNDEARATMVAFNVVCSYIGIRDHV